ncbi:MAG TPA: hypothetical protein VEK08_27020 [Planctomycetota bacterium]|nr:hypothetical protein [Planctomycetota bacterium]
MSSRFDDIVAADTPMFLAEFGESKVYRPLGVGANDKTISMILVDAKPRLVPAASSAQEFNECEVKISSRNNTEGHVSPSIAGHQGQTADQILNLHGIATWYVVDRYDDEDPSFHVLVLRDKCFPKDHEYGG